MSIRIRRSRGVAAASMATVSLFPLCAASAADVEVSIRNHTPQDVIEGPNVSIEAEFKSSTGHSIQRVEFLVDGQVVESKTLDQPAAQGTFIFAWDTTQITNDVHTVTTRAYDEQNHIGTSNLQLFVDNQKVDKAEPMLRITVPREGAVVSGQFNIRVQGQQRSAGEPIPYVIVKLDNDIVGWFNGQSSASFKYDGTVLKDGPHKVQAATRTGSNQEVLSPPIIVIVNKGGGDTTNYGSNPPPIDPTVDLSNTGSAPNLNVQGTTPIQLPSPQSNSGNSGSQPQPNRVSIRDLAHGTALPGEGNDPAFSSSPSNSGGQSATSGQTQFTTPSQNPSVHQTNSPPSQPVMQALVPNDSGATIERHSNGWYASDESGSQTQLDTRPAATAPITEPSVGALQVQDHTVAPQEIAFAQTGGEQPVFFNSPIVPSADRVDAIPPQIEPLKVALGPFVHNDRSTSSISAPTPSGDMESIQPSVSAVFATAPQPTSGPLRFGPPAIGHIFAAVPTSGAMPGTSGQSMALPKMNPSASEPVSLIPAEQAEIVLVTVKHRTHPAMQAPRIAMGTPLPGNGSMSRTPDTGDTEPPFPAVPAVIPPLPPNPANTKPTSVALQSTSDNTDNSFVPLKVRQRNTPEWLKLAYDNHVMNFDVPPRIVHHVTMTPFRALFEHAGGTVNWYPATQTVTGQNQGKLILIRIGGKNAMINNQPVPLVLPAFIERGRTLVPVGFISQAMDLNVHVNERTGEIILTSKHVVAIATE